MTTSKPMVSCPACGRKQPKQGPSAIYWCDKCRGQFDSDGDDGGDYSDTNPAARLEREERQRKPGYDKHTRARRGPK